MLLLGAGKTGSSGVYWFWEMSSPSTAEALQPSPLDQHFVFTQHFTLVWSRFECALGGRVRTW